MALAADTLLLMAQGLHFDRWKLNLVEILGCSQYSSNDIVSPSSSSRYAQSAQTTGIPLAFDLLLSSSSDLKLKTTLINVLTYAARCPRYSIVLDFEYTN